MISAYLSSELISAFAWTLIHSTWQIGLIAIILAIFINLNQSSKAHIRYNVSLAALGLIAVMVLVTFAYQMRGSGGEHILLTPVALEMQHVLPVADSMQSFFSFAETYKLFIVKVWLIGALLFLIRFVVGYLGVKRWVRLAVTADLQESKQFKKLKKKFRIHRQVLIRTTKEITTPMVVGFVKPVILFPIGLINQLSTEEVSAILAHELAHISRHDYILHLMQSLMEVVFYYHPALWYISKVINAERENCCDDLAIAQTGGAISYAKTLVKLQEMNQTPLYPALAMAGTKGFSNRIKRILNVPVQQSGMRDKMIGLMITLALLVTVNGDAEQNTAVDPQDLDVYIIDDCPRGIEDIKSYLDTIPERNNYHIKKRSHNQSVELQMQDGEIHRLKIDGQLVDRKDYSSVQGIIDSLRPDNKSGMITVFPDCGEDFGNIYFLDKYRRVTKLDTILSDFDARLKTIEDLTEGKLDFHVDQFSPEVVDSLIAEMEAKDFKSYISKKKIRVDSLRDLLPSFDSLSELSLVESGSRVFWTRVEPNDSSLSNLQVDCSSLADQLANALLEDQLISVEEISTLKLTGKHMKINDEKQPSSIWKKYKAIYENVTEVTLAQNSSMEMEINPESYQNRFPCSSLTQ
jgi:beta-lactamase regulating signal transducer with metallopeptidase domain